MNGLRATIGPRHLIPVHEKNSLDDPKTQPEENSMALKVRLRRTPLFSFDTSGTKSLFKFIDEKDRSNHQTFQIGRCRGLIN